MDMRPKGPPPTIGEIARGADEVAIDCRDCGRQVRIALAKLAMAAGIDAPFPAAAARLKCQGCGGKNVHARPAWRWR